MVDYGKWKWAIVTCYRGKGPHGHILPAPCRILYRTLSNRVEWNWITVDRFLLFTLSNHLFQPESPVPRFLESSRIRYPDRNFGLGPAYDLDLIGHGHFMIESYVFRCCRIRRCNVWKVITGDIDLSGTVNGTDLTKLRGQFLVALSASNFMYDVDVNNSIAGPDITVVRGRLLNTCTGCTCP